MWDELDKAIDDVIDMTNGDIDKFFKDKTVKTKENITEPKKDEKKEENVDTNEKGSKIDFKTFSSF
jgi:hypothetical protein